MRLIVAVGARANVVKVAPLLPALSAAGNQVQIAFGGVRQDALDSGTGFVRVFGVSMPAPTWYVDSGSGSSAAVTGVAMQSYERLFAIERPDAVLVCGDVNATLAAAVSAARAGLPVVHLEAGLRCGDLAMSDEINRVLISRVAAMHLVPTQLAMENLEDEGIEPERIHFVGNTVAEQALRELEDVQTVPLAGSMQLAERGYVLATFHRPAHLNDERWLAGVLEGLGRLRMQVVLPDSDAFVAATTRAGLSMPARLITEGPLPHLEILSLIRRAAAVITDAGGVQDEACVLCTPCVTVRSCTEHVATVICGANVLVEPEAAQIESALVTAIESRRQWAQPARWDRAVSDRVMRALRRGIIPLR